MADDPKAEVNSDVNAAIAKIKQIASSARRAAAGRSVRKGMSIDGGIANITGRVSPDEDDRVRAMIDRALENVELIRRRMANDQIEIDKLRLETQIMIAELLT
jgi:hypothetical protein